MKTSMKIGIGVFLAVVVVGIIVGISVMNSEPTQNEPIQNGGNNVVTDNKEENNTPINTELTVEAVKRAKETPASEFEYEDVEGGVAITGYNGKAEIVVIPEKINGKDVVEIGKKAFANNINIKAVKVTGAVEKIEEQAFSTCTELEILLTGSSLKIIEKYAFLGCANLKCIELNEGLETMGYGCFSMLPLIDEIYIPSTTKNFLAPFIGTHNNVITIMAEEGSPAQQFATENGYKFQAK